MVSAEALTPVSHGQKCLHKKPAAPSSVALNVNVQSCRLFVSVAAGHVWKGTNDSEKPNKGEIGGKSVLHDLQNTRM